MKMKVSVNAICLFSVKNITAANAIIQRRVGKYGDLE